MNNQFTSLSAGPISLAAIALLLGAAINESPASDGTNPTVAPLVETSSLPCPYSEPIGLLGHAQSVGNRAIGIDVQGDYAYVGDWHQGWHHRYAGVLQAFDVSDPCNPVRTDADETNYPGRNEIGDVAVHGDRIYVANDGNGLSVFDIGAYPDDPGSLGQVFGGRPGYDHWVVYEGGDHLYVGGWSSFVQAFDLPPAPPAQPGVGVTRIPDNFGVADMFVTANRAYLFTDPRLYIVDVNYLHGLPPYGVLPVIAEVILSGYGSGGEVMVQDGYAYLAMGESGTSLGGLRIVDVNETAPALVSTYDLPDGAGNIFAKGIGVAVSGDRAYIAAKGGLWVFDVSEPGATPILKHKFPLPAEFGNAMGARVELRGNLAYVTAYNDSGAGGLAIYKVPYPVAIDIKPGSDPNSINLCSNGAVPAAIFGSDVFNVDWVDIDTLRLAGAPVKVVGKKRPRALCSKDFVNDDLEYDLVCHFVTREMTGIEGEPPMATLNGLLFDGALIEGADTVNIVQNNCSEPEAS